METCKQTKQDQIDQDLSELNDLLDDLMPADEEELSMDTSQPPATPTSARGRKRKAEDPNASPKKKKKKKESVRKTPVPKRRIFYHDI
jgi:uncharacterized membrane protein YukC